MSWWDTVKGIFGGAGEVAEAGSAILEAGRTAAAMLSGRLQGRLYVWGEPSITGYVEGTLELTTAGGTHGTVTLTELALIPHFQTAGGRPMTQEERKVLMPASHGHMPISLDGLKRDGACLMPPIVIKPGDVVRIPMKIALQPMLRRLYPRLPEDVHVPASRLELNMLRRLWLDPHVTFELNTAGATENGGHFRGGYLFGNKWEMIRERPRRSWSVPAEVVPSLRLADYARSFLGLVAGDAFAELPAPKTDAEAPEIVDSPFFPRIEALEQRLSFDHAGSYQAHASTGRELETHLRWITELHKALRDGAEIDGIGYSNGRKDGPVELHRGPFRFFMYGPIGAAAKNEPFPDIKTLVIQIRRDNHMVNSESDLSGSGEWLTLFRHVRNYGELAQPWEGVDHPALRNVAVTREQLKSEIQKIVADCEPVGAAKRNSGPLPGQRMVKVSSRPFR